MLLLAMVALCALGIAAIALSPVERGRHVTANDRRSRQYRQTNVPEDRC